MTVVAEDDGWLRAVVFDDEDRWGSLIDNLHITQDRRRTGIGTALLTFPAEADAERATGKSTYLYALEQNPAAQQLYPAFGGTCIENAMVSPPAAYPPGSTAPPTSSASPGPTPHCWLAPPATHCRRRIPVRDDHRRCRRLISAHNIGASPSIARGRPRLFGVPIAVGSTPLGVQSSTLPRHATMAFHANVRV